MPNSITFTEVSNLTSLGANVIAAMQSLPAAPKRILQFDNFVYARAEVNKNRDEVSRENLNELAASLPLNWIDWGHDDKKRTGFFISAKVDGDAVTTGGIIWTDDDPRLPAKLAAGELQMSMEADADRAKCSVCGKEFASEKQYCEHLTPLENRFRFNASRQLFGMKAVGGALVARPAGTDTKADPNALHMIAHVVMAADKTAPIDPPEITTSAAPVKQKMTSAQLADRIKLSKAILAAQRFFAMEGANTPIPNFFQSVTPVLAPLMYHAGPELTPAPLGKHPLSPQQAAAEQAQAAVTQKVQAATETETKPKADAAARTGGISWLGITSTPTTDQTTLVWKR
jgi:hypothetical protein